MGYTFETTATLSFGSASEIAMAARKPAPPPPTSTMSWEEISSIVDDPLNDTLPLMEVSRRRGQTRGRDRYINAPASSTKGRTTGAARLCVRPRNGSAREVGRAFPDWQSLPIMLTWLRGCD